MGNNVAGGTQRLNQLALVRMVVGFKRSYTAGINQYLKNAVIHRLIHKSPPGKWYILQSPR